jgi:hypothetical protein
MKKLLLDVIYRTSEGTLQELVSRITGKTGMAGRLSTGQVKALLKDPTAKDILQKFVRKLKAQKNYGTKDKPKWKYIHKNVREFLPPKKDLRKPSRNFIAGAPTLMPPAPKKKRPAEGTTGVKG